MDSRKRKRLVRKIVKSRMRKRQIKYGPEHAKVRAFVTLSTKILKEINDRQRGMRRSERAYQRLAKARDIVADGRSAILYHHATLDDSRVKKAQALIKRIKARGLDYAVTFGTV